MYAPHASPARPRPAALEPVDLAASADLDVGGVAPIVGVIGATAALCVAYTLFRTHGLWMQPVLTAAARSWRRPAALGAVGPDRADARSGSPSIVWFGVATALTGLVALLPLAGRVAGADPTTLAGWLAVAMVTVEAAFGWALLRVRPVPTQPAARVRWALDAAIVWLCLNLCGWAVVTQHATLGSPVQLLVAFHCAVLAVATVAGSRRQSRPSAAGLCTAAMWVSTLALGGLAFALAFEPPVGWLLIVGAAFVAAPMLVWRGTLALTAPARPDAEWRSPSSPTATITFAAILAAFAGVRGFLEGEPIDPAGATIAVLALMALVIRHVTRTRATARPTIAMPAPALPASARPAPADSDPPRYLTSLLARTDAVTGLASRLQLSLAIAGLRCEPQIRGTLLVIGLDGVGAATGAAREEVLREVARRLTSAPGAALTQEDVAARLSETRFAVLARASVLRAYGLANRLLAALAQPMEIGGMTLRLGVCVGLAQVDGTPSAQDAVRRAELALRQARQAGPGRVEWYDVGVEEAVQRREVIERELPRALRQGELDLIYQPIMDLVHGRPLAVEALLRWRHPELGPLRPADVIPVAEEIGVIGELGQWVLREASAQLGAWRREGHDLSMCINVSPREIDTPEVTAELGRMLAAHDLPPDRLVLEFAESGIEDGERLAEQVGALRSVGVRTALDDFGAGPESLTHLRRVPIDMVKIGESFFGTSLAGGGGGGPDPAMPPVDVIVGVGRRLGVDVVAQGLEAPEQLAVVRTAGCRLGQGRLFAHPQPAERTEAYISTFRRRPAWPEQRGPAGDGLARTIR